MAASMLKPVIAIVDDDRDVLDALEAELTPHFSSLCRIETFSKPRDCLESVARWRAETRPIGVAIVDQRMPEMSGLELLGALRSTMDVQPPEDFTPTRFSRAVLLTGYAGLESAIAAKNEGAASAYLEKPWNPVQLQKVVSRCLRAFAHDSKTDTHFVFRELANAAEMLEALRLRFDVYSRTAGIHHVLPNSGEEHLDVDAYDRYARQFGLIEQSGAQSRLVGTLRVTGEARCSLADILEQMVPEDAPVGPRLRAVRKAALPLLEYVVERETVAKLVNRLVALGERVVEPGRLAIDPSYRESGAPGARHLARHIIESSVGFFFFFLRIPNAILTCIPPHDAFYKPYGFVLAAGTRVQFTPYIGTNVACLHGRFDRVPEPARSRCSEIAARLSLENGGGLVGARTIRRVSADRTEAATSSTRTCGARPWRRGCWARKDRTRPSHRACP
jgi:FixJ family two-component response regulator